MKLRIIYLVALAFMGHTNAYAKSSSAVGLAIRVETDQAGTTPDAQLVVRIDGTDDLTLLTDDGALASDTPGDGEYWSLLPGSPGPRRLLIGGTINGIQMLHDETVRFPASSDDELYVIHFVANRNDDFWTLRRSYAKSTTDTTPASDQTITSPITIFWGVFCALVTLAAFLRTTILEARRPPA